MIAAADIREARRRCGLTQEELARRVGTSQEAISAYENGRREPSLSTFRRVLAATGSRLIVQSGHRPIHQPSPARLEHAARTLAEVLALAEALPTRHEPELRFPGRGALGGGVS